MRGGKMKRRCVLAFCLLGMFLISASLVEAAEFGVFFKPGYMLEWTEKVPNSKRNPFVEERGMLYSAGADALFSPTKNIYLKSEAEVFFGQLDYKGSRLSDMSNYDTTGGRFGLTVEETLSYKIKISESFSLSPFLGLGFSAWHRDVCGENWYTGYGRLGIQGNSGRFFGKVGLLLPFYTEVYGGFKDISWLNNGREVKFSTNPKGVLTPFAEVGVRYKKWAASLSYELRKWEESDRVSLGNGVSAFQPETTQQLFSIKLEYFF
jgi:hypothetical protein